MAPAPAFKKRKTDSSSKKNFGAGKGGKFGKVGKVQQVEELTFDPAARQEYLTGFHKRKVQRIKHAQLENAKKEREEKVLHRREVCAKCHKA